MLHPDSDTLRFQTRPSAAPSISPVAIAQPFRLPARGGLSPRALRRVREYVSAHLDENISIKALASMVGLSRFHFSRAFKQSAGVTPQRYLLMCRVKRVQELLATTELPLSQIALGAGFADQSHCSRRFHELVGVTPRRYRWLTR